MARQTGLWNQTESRGNAFFRTYKPVWSNSHRLIQWTYFGCLDKRRDCRWCLLQLSIEKNSEILLYWRNINSILWKTIMESMLFKKLWSWATYIHWSFSQSLDPTSAKTSRRQRKATNALLGSSFNEAMSSCCDKTGSKSYSHRTSGSSSLLPSNQQKLASSCGLGPIFVVPFTVHVLIQTGEDSPWMSELM